MHNFILGFLKTPLSLIKHIDDGPIFNKTAHLKNIFNFLQNMKRMFINCQCQTTSII